MTLNTVERFERIEADLRTLLDQNLDPETEDYLEEAGAAVSAGFVSEFDEPINADDFEPEDDA